MVVPFVEDARVVGKKLAERLKQPVPIDNMPGASAQIGAQFVVKTKLDGCSLFMTANTSHSANPSLYQSWRYDPIKDYTPTTRVGELPFALAIHPGVPVKTLKELISYGMLSFATPNSTSLVASETIKRMAGIEIVGVPYKASLQAMTDLVGGQVQMYVADFGSGMTMFKTDRVRVLGVTTAESTWLLPDVPPIGKTVAGFHLISWSGIFGPAGLPKPVVERLSTEVLAVLAEKEVQDKLA